MMWRQDSKDMELLWLTPVLVLLISLGQRRLGDRAGGRLAALPVTSTSVIAIAAVDQGATTARELATGILTGAPIGVVVLATYRHLAANALKTNVPKVPFRAWDLAVRVAVATGCVAGVSVAARLLPPQVAGVLGAVPVLGLVLALMTHRCAGPRAAHALVSGVLNGTPTSLAFLGTLAAFLDVLPVPVAFGLAVLAGLLATRLRKAPQVLSAEQHRGDRVHAQVQVLPGDHQRRRDPQRRVVRLLAQHAAAHQLLARLACGPAAGRDLDPGPQPTATDLRDAVPDQVTQ